MIKYSAEFTKSVLIAPKSIDHFCCYRFCCCPIGSIRFFFLQFFPSFILGSIAFCIVCSLWKLNLLHRLHRFNAIGCCINGLKYSSVNKITVNQHLFGCCRANNCMYIIIHSHWMHVRVCALMRCFFLQFVSDSLFEFNFIILNWYIRAPKFMRIRITA